MTPLVRTDLAWAQLFTEYKQHPNPVRVRWDFCSDDPQKLLCIGGFKGGAAREDDAPQQPVIGRTRLFLELW